MLIWNITEQRLLGFWKRRFMLLAKAIIVAWLFCLLMKAVRLWMPGIAVVFRTLWLAPSNHSKLILSICKSRGADECPLITYVCRPEQRASSGRTERYTTSPVQAR